MSERSKKISRLLSDVQYRASYIKSKLDVLIPSQIKALRGDLTQADLAKLAGMRQSRISAMETPGKTNFNLETLVRLAATFRVALVVKFVPFSDLLLWENGYSQDEFSVMRLEDDSRFLSPSATDFKIDAAMRVSNLADQDTARTVYEGVNRAGECDLRLTIWNKAEAEVARLKQENADVHKILDLMFERFPSSSCANCREHSIGYRVAAWEEALRSDLSAKVRKAADRVGKDLWGDAWDVAVNDADREVFESMAAIILRALTEGEENK